MHGFFVDIGFYFIVGMGLVTFAILIYAIPCSGSKKAQANVIELPAKR